MAAPTKTPWNSVQRTASQTRWQSVATQSNTVTRKVIYRTNSFVELGTGLNVTNASGQFVAANPSFTITPTGAAATGAVHQVIVPGDIGSGAGVRVRMPGGGELVFQPLAMDYFDPVDGSGVLLDVVTNAVGWLVASNEIVFSNCFTHIKASIRLRNTRAGLESDLILHENPPEPETFGLSSSSRLEMLTEQLAGPVPAQRPSVLYEERDPVQAAAMLEPDLVDSELTYGQMKMGAGRAFVTPSTTNLPPAARSSRVAKSYLDFENRKIIIEAVEHRRVRSALLLLPPATNGVPQAGLSPFMKAERLAKNTRRLPVLAASGETREAALRPQPIQQHAQLTTPQNATVQLAGARASRPPGGAAALGGTGYQPVPPGYQPGGREERAEEPVDAPSLGAFPSVPRGTGRLPVLPTEESPPLGLSTESNPDAPSPAFVLDYYLVNIYGETDLTFRSDETYWVSAPIALTGTTTIEGGTVIKFSEATGLYFFEEYALVCDTTNHLPAVFTSYDDNSVGEDIGGSGSPVPIGTWGLYFISGGSRQLSNVRFTYLSNPIAMEGGGSANDLTLRNVQVRKADYVLDSGTTDFKIYNGLFVEAGMLFSYAGSFVGEHLTVHNATATVLGGGGTTTATVKNSLLVKVTSAPGSYGTYTETFTANLTNASGVFQTVEGGGYYLTNGTYRNIGTTNIHSQLQAALAEMTTHAPETLTGTLATNRTLLPRAIRDTDTPDLGYHYPAVDYLAKTVSVANATLTMLNGVVVAGGFSSNALWTPALSLNPGKLISLGTPTRLNRLLRASQVQENVQERGYILLQDGQEDTFKPELTLRFTELSSLADESYLLAVSQAARRVELSHSAFLNGQYVTLTLYGGSEQTVGLTNNLFRRVEFGVVGNSHANFYAYNNLFKDGSFGLTGGNADWRVSDNVFDCVTVTDDAGASVGTNNAYVGGVGPLTFDASPVTLTNLAYLSGPLGRYYVSGTTLQNAGSRNADAAGLYHFTTTTNQIRETNSTVDIGLHYVAVGTGGSPVDTDGEGLADYLEDQNGDGVVNATETSYLLADTDGDKLPDFYELALGYDPLVADTGNTGVLDGDKDFDGDGLSNAGELNVYSSNPGVAKSLNTEVTDAQFKFAATASLSGPPSTEADLIYAISAGNIRLRLTNVSAGSNYDIYRCTGFTGTNSDYLWYGPWSRLYQGTNAQRVWDFTDTNLSAFYMAGSAADTDNDGLTDGAEVLITHTTVDVADAPRKIYETAVSNQNPSAWFKLNDSSFTNSVTSGQSLTNFGGLWNPDPFAVGNSAYSFSQPSNNLVVTNDFIGGGTSDPTNRGSFTLLFKALTTKATSKRYVLSQGLDTSTSSGNAIAVYFTNSGPLKFGVGPVEQTLLEDSNIVRGAWYYLAVTCDETRTNSNAVRWYLGQVGNNTLQVGGFAMGGGAKKFGNTNAITLGNREASTASAFRESTATNGSIDQVAFWQRELAEAEVNAQFNSLKGLFQGPSKVFDLTRWNLLLPVNKTNQLNTNHLALEIDTGWLNSGFRYIDPANWTQKYFYLSTTNTMVFEAPWNGARSTAGSGARSELRGTLADGSEDNWTLAGTNTLEATCTVHVAGINDTNKLIIGQIYSKSAGSPSFAINYNFPSNKNVSVTYKLNPTNSLDNNLILATNVNLLDLIYYKVQLIDDGTNVSLHGEVRTNGVPYPPPLNVPLTTNPTNAWHSATFYFKAGCYYPNYPTNGTAKVTFSSLDARHGP